MVTPQLVQCFDQALSLIRSAVEAGTSKGAYLHGSFGSGKSHFMAVLSLLLQNHPGARSIPELAEVMSRHNRWAGRADPLAQAVAQRGGPRLQRAAG